MLYCTISPWEDSQSTQRNCFPPQENNRQVKCSISQNATEIELTDWLLVAAILDLITLLACGSREVGSNSSELTVSLPRVKWAPA